MPKNKKFPDNVIPVNFKKKNHIPNMRELYPDAFKMYVDKDSENQTEFSRYMSEYVDDINKVDEKENSDDKES